MFIVRHILKLFLAHWKRFAAFLCLAALLCIAAGLLGVYFSETVRRVEPVRLLVVDQDNSLESRLLYGMLSGSESYAGILELEKAGLESATRQLEAGQAAAAVVLPQGFSASVMSGENKPFTMLYSSASPLKARLVQAYADAFTDMLRTSQISVYAALEYAARHGDADQYQAMFMQSNMAFLRRVGERDQLFDKQTLTATGQVPVFAYYLVHALVFLLLLLPLLLPDILRRALSPAVTIRLRQLGTGRAKVVLCSWAAVLLLLLPVDAAVLFALVRLTGAAAPALLAPLLVFTMVLDAYGLFAALLCKTASAGSLLLSLLAVAGLLAGGGVLPSDYLAPWAQAFGRFTLQHWAARGLHGGVTGQFAALPLAVMAGFTCLLLLGSALLLRRRDERRRWL